MGRSIALRAIVRSLRLRAMLASQLAWLSIATDRCSSAIAQERSIVSTRSGKCSPGRNMSLPYRPIILHLGRTTNFMLPAQRFPALIRSFALTRLETQRSFFAVLAGRRDWLLTRLEVFTWPRR